MKKMQEIKKSIRTILTELDDSELVYIWNEYCHETYKFDDEILDAYQLEEWASNGGDVMNILNRFYFGSDDEQPGTSANPNRNYFTFNGYGNIISFDHIYNQFTDEFYYIFEDDLIDYMIKESRHFDNSEIECLIDEYNELLEA